MSRKYPRSASKHYQHGLDHQTKCEECHEVIQKGEKCTVVVTQWTWFRGDDTVDTFHVECLRKWRKRNEIN